MNKLLAKYKSLSAPVKASLWFLICGVIQKALSMITTPIFTRLLTTAEYGEYTVFSSWHNILAVFITLNLTAGVFTQGLVKFSDDREKFASSMYGLSFLLSIIWFIIYICGYKLWNSLLDLSTTVMICMLVITCTSAFFGFWSAKQRVDYKYRALVFLTLTLAVIRPIVEFIAIKLFPDTKTTARIVGATIIDVLAFSWMFFLQLHKNKTLYSPKYWKHALKFNLPLIPHYLSQTVLASSDRIMIKNYCGEGNAGIYSLAYSLAMILLIVNNAISNTLSPWIYKKIKEKRYGDITNPAYMLLIFVAIVCLLLISFAPEAVAFFAPKSYGAAIWAVPPVAMSVYFIFMYDLIAKFAFYAEKTGYIMIASVICAAANIGLNAVFIPKFGFIAAAYTTITCYIFYDIFHYILMRIIQKKYMENVKVYNPLIIIGISLVFVAIGFSVMALYKYTVIRYIILVVGLVAIILMHQKIIGLYKTITSK